MEMTMSCKCIVIAEGDYEGTHEFNTQVEYDAFCEGVSTGVNLFGGGSCIVVTKENIGEYGKKVDALIQEYLEEE